MSPYTAKADGSKKQVKWCRHGHHHFTAGTRRAPAVCRICGMEISIGFPYWRKKGARP